MTDWPIGNVQVEAWTHIDTQVLGAPAASVSFTGIAAAAAPRLRMYSYAVKDGTAGVITVRANNDGGATYEYQDVTANGAAVSAARVAGATAVTLTTDDSQDNDTPALYMIEIGKPIAGEVGRGTSKSAYIDASAATIMLEVLAFEWANVAALLNRLDILFAGGTGAVAGTRIVLEGAA